MSQIKICGLTDLQTLKGVCEFDVHYVGFVHHPGSVRHVDILYLAKLMEHTPQHISNVLVLIDPVDSKLDYIFEWCKPDYIQLHGGESPERVAAIKEKYDTKVIKAAPIAYRSDVEQAKQYEGIADIISFDTKAEKGISGGTGKTFDWDYLAGYENGQAWMLSGGLSVENVADAIQVTGAPIVDVSSNVESPVKSGKKDMKKITAFVDAVKAA